MNDVLYLAWRYLAYHRLKSSILVASITIIVYLPAGLNILVSGSARELAARANATPLLVGAKGSTIELVLGSLYFEADAPPPMRYAEMALVQQSGLARAIPLYTRFRTLHSPIVGTSLEYFDFRGLKFARGRQFAMLGECVLGAQAAREAEVTPGDQVQSMPETVFDLAGVYPLNMYVVGVLKPNGTPDDRAVFVDLKTAWVIQGLAHGHLDLSQADAENEVQNKEGNRITAKPSVMQYNEITAANIASFHFHGESADYPITSVIAVPHNEKSSVLLQGRYVDEDQQVQIVRPNRVMGELLQTIFSIRRYVIIAVVLVALATLASLALVFTLSLQLRRREIETMIKIGGSPGRIASVLAAEILGVLLAGAALAGALSLATSLLAVPATRLIVRMT